LLGLVIIVAMAVVDIIVDIDDYEMEDDYDEEY